MKVTIKMIAEKAEVSISTVSKILNNYEDVSEQTKERVMKIIQETGYNMKKFTDESSSKSMNLIGVLFAGKLNVELNNHFFIDVINSFKKRIGFLGYDLLLFSNEEFHNTGKDYLERCKYYQVDGCLIIAGDDLEPSISELDQSNIPCIGVDIKLSGQQSGYIMSDNSKISQKVVEHFYLQGYKEIAYIGGAENSYVSQLRKESFVTALSNYGLANVDDWIVDGSDFFENSGYIAMKNMIHTGHVPRAVFAASDQLAFGAIKLLKENNYRVPEDVAVIGCDDMDACKYMDPPLTTTKQDKEKIGRLAAMMLYDLIHNQLSSSSVLVEPELVVRQSCGYDPTTFNR
jgi:LacI family transcriptional regulator